MIEHALTGNRTYRLWIVFLLALIAAGLAGYRDQLTYGLGITGMGRDISWGVYIGQFTFLVGVAASAVMLVLPYYLHNYKTFGKMLVLGEFLAVAAVLMCMLFVIVDMGKPERVLNILLFPTPRSMVFWDVVVLNGYLLLNLVCGWVALEAEQAGVPPPRWIKPLIYLSIPWAISIHTVTAFLYAGMPGRDLWLTAILAPRFLASAFAAGPALLIALSLLLKRLTAFDVGPEAIDKLATIVLYAALVNFFFTAMEFFTAFYSGIPAAERPLTYLFFGLEGHAGLRPAMWLSTLLGAAGVAVLLAPGLRLRERYLVPACAAIFLSLWLDKGVGLIIGGFIPSPLETVSDYSPTGHEVLITAGVWATGSLVLTLLYKTAIGVKQRA
jgi:molybdopterin-containing oxidoreductase family membrane subunit